MTIITQIGKVFLRLTEQNVKTVDYLTLAGTRYKMGVRENCTYLDLRHKIMIGFHWNLYVNLNMKLKTPCILQTLFLFSCYNAVFL